MERNQLNIYSTGQEFESFVAELLRRNEFRVEDAASNSNFGFDIQAEINQINIIVEVKIQRTKIARIDLLRRACQQLISIHKRFSDSIPLLIVPNATSQSFKRDMLENYGIQIWDISDLFGLAINFSDLYHFLDNFLYKLFGESVEEYSLVDQNVADKIIPNLLAVKSSQKEDNIVELKGRTLCEELKDIPVAQSGYKRFEEKCTEILRYLFESDLDLWKDQNNTEDGLHFFDLLCRLRPSGRNFWEEILSDFKSRYIVFEYKNYTDPITQKEIYTTEKYLFTTALRSVAIIVAKNDGDSNSYKAATGALKEAGKLIVIISADDLCKMLQMKDTGIDPAELLRDKIDNLLMPMTR